MVACPYVKSLVCRDEECFSTISPKLFADALQEVHDLALFSRVFKLYAAVSLLIM